MKGMEVLGVLGDWGPVLFGVGFLAPLIAQTMEAIGVPVPFGWPPITVGLGVGLVGGLVAKVRRSWV